MNIKTPMQLQLEQAIGVLRQFVNANDHEDQPLYMVALDSARDLTGIKDPTLAVVARIKPTAEELAKLLETAVEVLGPEQGWETDDSTQAEFFRRAIPALRAIGMWDADQARQEQANMLSDARTLADSIIADIVDPEAGDELRDSKSFSELHDYCDANMLGKTAEVFNALGGAANQAALDTINAAQNIVDAWLRARNSPSSGDNAGQHAGKGAA